MNVTSLETRVGMNHKTHQLHKSIVLAQRDKTVFGGLSPALELEVGRTFFPQTRPYQSQDLKHTLVFPVHFLWNSRYLFHSQDSAPAQLPETLQDQQGSAVSFIQPLLAHSK